MQLSVLCASLPDVEGSSAAQLVPACLLQKTNAKMSHLAHWAREHRLSLCKILWAVCVDSADKTVSITLAYAGVAARAWAKLKAPIAYCNSA